MARLSSCLSPRSPVDSPSLGTWRRCVALMLLTIAPVSWSQSDAESPVVVVKVQQLSELTTAQRLVAPATVQSANRAIVAARVAANIDRIDVEVGQRVTQGETLARLDSIDYDLALEQAKAQLASTEAQIEQARLRLKRAQELSGNQYISADDLLARTTDVTVLEANRSANQIAIRVAENEVAKTRIEAPFDAVVVSRSAQVGSFVMASAPLFELVQLNNPEVEASVSSDLIESVRAGRSLRFERNEQSWPLTLERISPVVITDSGAQLVRARFVDEEAPIGSSGRLSWVDGAGLIPADLLVRRGQSLGLFVVEGNRVRFTPIEGAQEGRPTATQLDLNSPIVTLGRYKLQDGQRIEIVTD